MKKGDSKKEEIYLFVKEFSQKHGYPPTIREICKSVKLKSTSTVHAYLKQLHREGLLDKEDNKTRAVVVSGKRTAGQVPIMGRVTAGNPIYAFDDFNGFLNYTVPDDSDCFALEIKGDSMTGVGIVDGDYVVVEKCETARQNQIVVAIVDEHGESEATVKRYRVEGEKRWLMPENPNYSPIDGDNFRILGRVRAVVREY